MSDKEYDASKVRVTIGGVEVMPHVEASDGYTIDTLTEEYAEVYAAGRAYGFGGKPPAFTFTEPPRTIREHGWKWRR